MLLFSPLLLVDGGCGCCWLWLLLVVVGVVGGADAGGCNCCWWRLLLVLLLLYCFGLALLSLLSSSSLLLPLLLLLFFCFRVLLLPLQCEILTVHKSVEDDSRFTDSLDKFSVL